MRRKLFLSTLPLLGVVAAVNTAQAQIPRTMNYQGRLTSTSGQPVPDGSYTMTISVYDVQNGGVALWSETQSLAVSGGIFNAILGAISPLNLPFDKQHYGHHAGTGTELVPRTQLTSVPYALNAWTVSDGAITTAKIADGAITLPKISPTK